MGEISAIAGRWLDRRLPPAMEALGIRTVAAISQSIDTLCPAYHSEHGGHHSPELQPPYKETGNLQAGLSHSERIEGGDYVCVISSKRAPARKGESELVPEFLEFGTQFMAPRPYMRPAMNGANVPESMRQSLSSDAPYAGAM